LDGDFIGLFDRAFRNIWRKKSRSAMVISLLVIAMATMLSVYSSVEGSKAHTQDMIDEYQITLEDMVEQSEQDLLGITVSKMRGRMSEDTTSTMTSATASEIEELDEVSEVIEVVSKPFGDFESMFSEGERKSLREKMGGLGGRMETMVDYIITGVPLSVESLEDINLLPDNIIEGRTLWSNDIGCALISEELKDFFDADIGDVIEVGEGSLEVIGIYSSSLQNKNVYTSIYSARELLEMDYNEVSELRVIASNESVVEGLVAVLQEYYTSYQVSSNLETSARQVESMTRRTDEQINSLNTDIEEIESQGTMVVGISAGTAGLIVLFIMLYTVKERTKEIGTMKAIGFTNGSIMFQIVVEGIFLAVISGLVGIFLGWVGSPIISKLLLPETESVTQGEITLFMIGAGLIIMVALGILGSIYPALVASRKSPVEAMRHE